MKNLTDPRKEQVPFSMAKLNVELMHNCFPRHQHMETVRMKLDIETEREMRRVKMKRNNSLQVNNSPPAYSCSSNLPTWVASL